MTRREMLRLLSYSGASLANLGAIASFFSGCAYSRVEKPSKYPDRYGLTIMADGFRADMFKEMLDAGELPNIKEHLVDRGKMVKNCITTFPSTSGPAHLPFINGCMPGNNNCPGIRWIDRRNNEIRDYTSLESIKANTDFPKSNYTLYEMLADERTACIFDFVSRGAKDFRRPPFKTMMEFLRGGMDVWKYQIDQDAVNVFKEIFDTEDTPPKYTFVWLPALDHITHVYGSKSEIVCEKARNIDDLVGQIMKTLQKKRIYNETLVSLVSDHGLRDTNVNTKIREILIGYGFSVLEDLTGNDNYNSLLIHNAARAVSGDNFALLYFAKKRKYRFFTYSDWVNPTEYGDLRSFPLDDGSETRDLIELLRNEEFIKLVMAKEKEDVYRIFSKAGEGKIERNSSSLHLKYTVINGSDPLGYTGNADSAGLMNEEFHDKDEWFAKTTGTDYPDALYQVSQLFDTERCGDIVLSSKPGYDLMKIDEPRLAGHGGIEKAEMMVPCVIAGPGIGQGVIEKARTIDLYPTYLEFFGFPYYEGEVLNVFL